MIGKAVFCEHRVFERRESERICETRAQVKETWYTGKRDLVYR
jgi:hypothetical protein